MNQIMQLVLFFLEKKIDGISFSEQFIDNWRLLGKTGEVLKINPELSEALSSIFCFADLFNPNEDREDYEFDENKLRAEVEKTIQRFFI